MRRLHSIEAIDLAASVVLIVGTWLLYRNVLRLWWTYDDAYHLHTAIEHRIWQYFFDPAVGRRIANQLFTPLLQMSYDVELSLFGFSAGRFLAIHLSEIALTAIAIYAAARLWLVPLFAGSAAFLFIAGVPFVSLATELMVMHYLESIALAALAVIAFVIGLRTSKRPLLMLSALSYLAAMLAKEIAVPLPLLLCVLPERDLRTRVRALAAHAAALVIYAGWRRIMLGTLLGGYGWAAASVWTLLHSLPVKIIGAFGIAPAAVMLIGVIAALRSRRGAMLVIAGLIIAIAPIIPVSAHMEERFAVVPWLWWCVSFAAGCASLRLRVAPVLVAAAAIVAIFANRQQWRSEFRSSLRQSEEARLFFALGPNDLLGHPLIPPGAINELKWLKEDYLHRPRGSGWFYDDLFLCDGGANGKRVWKYEGHAVTEMTNRIPLMTRAYCGRIRPSAPLNADFHFRDGTLSWRFGPYRDGSWSVVMAGGILAFDVPAADAFRLGDISGITFRVRYASPAGWVTYSPELQLDFIHHPDFVWRR